MLQQSPEQYLPKNLKVIKLCCIFIIGESYLAQNRQTAKDHKELCSRKRREVSIRLLLPVSECSDISSQVTGQTSRCPLCCREGLQIDFAEVNSELVHGVDKVCSCLPQVLCGKEIEVSQNRAQHTQITTIHGNPRVAESVYLLVCNKDKGAKMKL